MNDERFVDACEDLADEGRHNGHYEGHAWDAIVVGAGAAGSVYAAELTKAGLRVLLLEKGKHYQNHRQDFVENELAWFDRLWSNNDYQTTGGAFSGGPNFGRGVGGGTLVWAGVSTRFFDHDFRMRSLYGQPTGTTLEDWPIRLREIEPYYNEAERQMGVSGQRTPWDVPHKPPLPHPAFPLFPGSQRLAQGMALLGIRSAPAPVAIVSHAEPQNERASCVHCGYCRSGCRIDAKYQSDHVLIAPALKTGRLKLVAGAVVTKINQGRSPTEATGVTYFDSDKVMHSVRGRVIIVASNPMEIPRLFLNSANPRHPDGLGNRFGNVGRNFFCKSAMMMIGVTDTCLDTGVGYTMGNIMTLDFARSRDPKRQVGGFMLVALNGANPGAVGVTPYKPLFGSPLKKAMLAYNRSLVLSCISEGMPAAENRVTVDPGRLDDFGVPKANIHFQWQGNDTRLLAEGVETAKKILSASGAHTVVTPPAPGETHPGGTMRMGHDPRTSVTDEYGRVHGLNNVYVGGGAIFPTGSSVNPTLTIHALALRSAQHLARRFGVAAGLRH